METVIFIGNVGIRLNRAIVARLRIGVLRLALPTFLLFAIVVFSSLSPHLSAQGLSPQKLLTQYAVRSWSTDEGSPSTAVLDILQTHDSFIWLATFNGLARFDGMRFTAFNRSTDSSIASAGFYCLCEDSTGTLWAGSTSGNGLLRFSNGKFTTYTQRDSLASGTIHALLFVPHQTMSSNTSRTPSQNGTLWIGTALGLQKAIVSPNSSKITIETIPGLAGISVWALHRDGNGNIWIGTRGKGVFCITNDGSVKKIPSTFGESTIAVSFASGLGDTLWVAGLEQGLSFIVGNKLTAFTGSNARNIQKSVVRKVFCDRYKTLWIGTVNEQLVRYRSGIVDMVTEGNKLTNIEAIHEDIEGNLWIGTYYTALSCLSDGKFTNFTTDEGLSNPIVHHIYQDHDGSMWIGTNKGLNHIRFSATRKPMIQQFTADNGSLPDNTVRNILRDRRGRLWIATFGGLVCRDGNRSTTYTTKDGLTYNEVRLVFEDRDGNIWADTRKGLNLVEERNGKVKFTTYSREGNGLSNDYFLSISQDQHGTMWFGTDGGGAIAFRNGVFRSYTTSEGLPANVVFKVYEDSKGILWFATVNGLVRCDDERRSIFSTIDNRHGLPSTVIFDILEDNNGAFWLTTPDGVIAIRREELMRCADGTLKRLLYSQYTKTDGMSATECTGASKGFSTGDMIWLPTLNGVSIR
jgi:ligand-binding sensor domain-containing protein